MIESTTSQDVCYARFLVVTLRAFVSLFLRRISDTKRSCPFGFGAGEVGRIGRLNQEAGESPGIKGW